MTNIKRFIVLLLVLSSVSILGCFQDAYISSATPDPAKTIYVKPGDIVDFNVEVTSLSSDPSFAADEVYWVSSPNDHAFVSGVKKARLTVSDSEASNTINVLVYLYQYNFDNQPYPDEKDNVTWTVKIIPEPGKTVWGGDYYINSDYDIELLEGYTEINGLLMIDGTFTLEKLNLLKSINSVNDLFIRIQNSPGVENLEFLSSLTSVKNNMSVIDNDTITSLNGLENLTTLDGVGIVNNHALKSLDGLEHLESIGKAFQAMQIKGNDALTSLKGLRNLAFIEGDCIIENNSVLKSLAGLEKISKIGGKLQIAENPLLSSLVGFSHLKTIGEDLFIENNPAITSLAGLNSLTTIGESLNAANNAQLANLGLVNLCSTGETSISYGYDFIFENNPELCDNLIDDLVVQVENCIGISANIIEKDNKDCSAP